MFSKIKLIYLVLIFFSFIYLISLYPVFSTGDGGGLAVSAYMLGIAHPPGYPFYIELGKLISFIPVGNIGSRIALISVLFSILSLYMVYLITKILIIKITNNEQYIEIFSVISVVFLAVSYSYYFNSVVIKFYTLNLFLVLVLFYIGLKSLIEGNLNYKYMLTASFLLGLGASIHHTSLIIFPALLFVGFIYFKNFIKWLLPAVLFLVLGFLVNLHLYIRSQVDAFAAAHKAENFEKFVAMILRKFYGSGSSLDAPVSALGSGEGLYYSLKNILYLFNINFSYAFIFFLLLGFFALFRKDKKIFLYTLIAFIMYSLILAKITLSGPFTIGMLYVAANQYFLPALAFFSIISSLGIYYSFIFIKNQKMEFTYKFVPKILIAFPLVFLIGRLNETNNFNNWVPYYHGKDLLAITPISSIFSTYGDNHTFELWYVKILGRFRDDVCHLTSHYYNNTNWRIEGCKPKDIYKNNIPEFFQGNLQSIMEKKRFLSSVNLAPEHPFYNFVKIKPLLYAFFWLKKDDNTPEEWFDNLNISKFKFLTPEVCLNHNTDDIFTFEMCKFFSNSYLVMASSIKPAIRLNELVVDADISYGSFKAPFKLTIYVSPQNQSFLEMFKAIRAYNDYSQSYLIPEELEKNVK